MEARIPQLMGSQRLGSSLETPELQESLAQESGLENGYN